MANDYSIVVWSSSEKLPIVLYASGSDALDALAQLVDDGILPQGRSDMRLVAAVSGTLHPAATVTDIAMDPRRSLGAARSEKFSVFGFWQQSGETYSSVEQAASGIQAMRLAVARAASPNRAGQELQVVLAFPGVHATLVSRENVPAYW